jgi:hypothetical protein
VHRTLNAEMTRLPGQPIGRRWKRCDEFRHTYNHGHPHEALGRKLTAKIYRPSLRPDTVGASSGTWRPAKAARTWMMRWQSDVTFTSGTCAANGPVSTSSKTASGRFTPDPCRSLGFDEREMRFYG